MSGAGPMAVAALVGYLIGSFPTGYLVGRRRGIDIRQHGSGNIGATNALRVLGPKLGLVVFVLDALKGAAPVAVAGWLVSAGWLGGDIAVQIATAAGTLAGHVWPFTLGFQGGRAVATSLGVFLVLSPGVALVALGVFAVVVALTRYVSLGSIVGSVTAAVGLWFAAVPRPVAWFGAAGAALIIWRHRPNIARLLTGTESRIGSPRGPGSRLDSSTAEKEEG